MSSASRRASLVLIALLLGACPDNGEGGPAEPPADLTTAEGYCNARFQVLCQQAAGCGFAQHGDCLRDGLDELEECIVEIGAAVFDAGAAVDPERWAACSAAETASCVKAYPSLACDGVFVGTKRAGQVCSSSAQCLPGWCDIQGDDCVGLCVAARAQGERWLDEASGDTYPCAPGLHRAADGTCQAPPAAGEGCGPEGECAVGAVCIEGTCRTHAEAQAACPAHEPHEQCQVRSLCYPDQLEGLSCELSYILYVANGHDCSQPADFAITRRCQPAHVCGPDQLCVRWLEEADECTPDGYRGGCAEGLWCDPATTSCRLPGQLGAACSDAISISCADGLWCDANSCREPQATAGFACDPDWWDSCADDLVCDFDTQACKSLPGYGLPCVGPGHKCADGLVCKSGTCEALSELGGPCQTDTECKSGRCSPEDQICLEACSG